MELNHREWAALQIQRVWRGHRVRQRVRRAADQTLLEMVLELRDTHHLRRLLQRERARVLVRAEQLQVGSAADAVKKNANNQERGSSLVEG